MPVLGLQGRAALLLSGLRAKGLEFEGGLQGLEALAGKGLEGFDAKDIQLVVDRAVHAALRRGITQGAAGRQQTGVSTAAAAAGNGTGGGRKSAGQAKAGSNDQQQQQLLVTVEDVQQALSGYVAAALWRAGQHKGQQQAAEGGLQGWEDVGESGATPLGWGQPCPRFACMLLSTCLSRRGLPALLVECMYTLQLCFVSCV